MARRLIKWSIGAPALPPTGISVEWLDSALKSVRSRRGRLASVLRLGRRAGLARLNTHRVHGILIEFMLRLRHRHLRERHP